MSEFDAINFQSAALQAAAIRHAEDDGIGGIDSTVYANPKCIRCKGNGYIARDDGGAMPRQHLCPCVVEGRRRHACEMRIRRLFGAGGSKMTLGAYDPGNSQLNQAALNGCIAYVENFPAFQREGVGFALMGEPGIGKTHLATGTLIALIKRWPGKSGGLLTPFHLSVPEMLNLKRKSFQDETVNDVIDSAMYADVTLLDDLGAEYRRDGSEGMSWVDEQLYMILNHRLTHNLPTLYTTNLTKTRLGQLLNERISRRLNEKTIAVWPVEANKNLPGRSYPELQAILRGEQPNPAAQPKSAAAVWKPGMAALRAYYRREQHSRVPADHTEGDFPLGRWLAAQRAAYAQGKLTAEQIAQLEKVPDWEWKPSDGTDR